MAKSPRRHQSRTTVSSKPTGTAKGHNRLRIIGGQWRGRKLSFPDIQGLRPTPDRVRETLFNWLQPTIDGCRCLDLFCGSGALGLEALSRGAASATLIDASSEVIAQLRQNLTLLKAENVELVQARAQHWLQQPSLEGATFELVFLDPPFHQQMLAECCTLLQQQQLLAPKALVYIEVERQLKPLPIPDDWQVLRHKDSGQVSSYLCQAPDRGQQT